MIINDIIHDNEVCLNMLDVTECGQLKMTNDVSAEVGVPYFETIPSGQIESPATDILQSMSDIQRFAHGDSGRCQASNSKNFR